MSTPKKNTISVDLVGPPSDKGQALLSDFAWVLQSMRRCLRHVERCVTGSSASIEYKIRELRTGSAIAEIEPIEKHKGTAHTIETVDLFRDTVSCLETSKGIDERIDTEALEAFRGLFVPLKRSASKLDIGGTEISTQFVASIENLLRDSIVSLGSISGRLGTVDVHKTEKFVVYPPASTAEINCVFPDEMFDQVRSALKKDVTVYGLLHYKKDSTFPSKVEVEDIDVHPGDSDLPSLSNLRGIFSDLNEKRDSSEIVRSLRNEW